MRRAQHAVGLQQWMQLFDPFRADHFVGDAEICVDGFEVTIAFQFRCSIGDADTARVVKADRMT